jgi:DNA-binding response OmpR family regulator
MEENIVEKTVLIVDDERDWVRALMIRLGHEGYRIEVAFEALSGVAQAINLVPDAILLDIMMPAGGGISVLKNIRNSSKSFNIPVIVITARSDKETREAAEKLGISAYFVKPIETVKLLEKLREVIK